MSEIVGCQWSRACFIRVVNKEIEVRIRQLALEKTSQPYRPACSLEESVDAHSDTPFLDRSTPLQETPPGYASRHQ